MKIYAVSEKAEEAFKHFSDRHRECYCRTCLMANALLRYMPDRFYLDGELAKTVGMKQALTVAVKVPGNREMSGIAARRIWTELGYHPRYQHDTCFLPEA